MSVRTICRRDVWTTTPDVSARAAVRLMAEHNVGFLVVTEPDSRTPVGVLTDRDVALDVLRRKLDADAVRVGDLMREPVVSIGVDAPLSHAIDRMCVRGLRRLPVLEGDGTLAGLVSWDDVSLLVARELWGVAGAIETQPAQPHPDVEALRREQAIDWSE